MSIMLFVVFSFPPLRLFCASSGLTIFFCSEKTPGYLNELTSNIPIMSADGNTQTIDFLKMLLKFIVLLNGILTKG